MSLALSVVIPNSRIDPCLAFCVHALLENGEIVGVAEFE